MSTLQSLVSKVRVVILGGGAVTRDCYLAAAPKARNIEIVGIVEPAKAAHEPLRQRGFNGEILELEAGEFLGNAELLARLKGDAVIVAVPNQHHENVAALAIEKGLHVLSEKPLAVTAHGCRRLQMAASQANVILSVGMVRRLLPSVDALRSILRKGLLGSIESIEIEDGAPYGWNPTSAAPFLPQNGGILMDMGVHYLDLLYDLFGALTPEEYQDDWEGGCEANCELRLRTEGGIPVVLRLSRTRTLGNRAKFQSKEGTLFLKKDDFRHCYWSTYSSPVLEASFSSGILASEAQPFESSFARELDEFARCVRGRERPRVDGEDAAHVLGLIEHAYAISRKKHSRGPLAEAKGNVTVTGATGFIGSHLVERLCREGYSVVAPIRNFQTCSYIARFPVELPRWNLLDTTSIRRAVKGSRYVFHLAYSGRAEDVESTIVDGTQRLVEACIAEEVECVVLLSSMYVYGFPQTSELVDESWPYRPYGGKYGKAKAEMERWSLNRARTSGKTRIVILAPTCVFGPRGATYTRLPAELTAEGKFCWIEEGRGIVNYTHVENVVDALCLAASSPRAHGERFLVNDGSCTWKTFLEPLLEPLGVEIPSLTEGELHRINRDNLPSTADRLRSVLSSHELRDFVNATPLLAFVKKLLVKHVPESRKLVSALPTDTSAAKPVPPEWLGALFGTHQTRFSAEKIKSLLGWAPRVSLNEGQRASLQWLSECGALGVKAFKRAA